MSGVSKVLAVTELLEHILANAMMQDVLRCQRVNKRFKHVIDSSPRLQEKLFLKAAAPTGADGRPVKPQPNPLLLYALSATYSDHKLLQRFVAGTTLVRTIQTGHFFTIDYDKSKEPRELKPGSWERMLVLQPPAWEGVQQVSVPVAGERAQILFRSLNKLIIKMAMKSRAQARSTGTLPGLRNNKDVIEVFVSGDCEIIDGMVVLR